MLLFTSQFNWELVKKAQKTIEERAKLQEKLFKLFEKSETTKKELRESMRSS